MNQDEDPFPFPPQLDDHHFRHVVRVFFAISLLACIVSMSEQGADWWQAKRRDETTSIVTRLLFFINACVAMYSGAKVIGQVAMPANDAIVLPRGAALVGARGTEATCTAQGFLAIASLTAFFVLDASLSLCYLLMIGYEWKEIKLKTLEVYFHTLTWLWVLIWASPGLFLKFYNPMDDTCWLLQRRVCTDLQPDGMCHATVVDRGVQHVGYLQLLARIALLTIMVHFLFTLYVMARVWWFAWKRAKAITQLQDTSTQRLVGKALLYISVALVHEIPVAIYMLLYILHKDGISTFLWRFHQVPFAFVGTNNLFVYMWGRRNMKTPLGKAARFGLDIFIKTVSYVQGRLRRLTTQGPLHDQQLVPTGRDLFATTTIHDGGHEVPDPKC